MTSRLVEYFLTVSHGATLEPVSTQADGTQATQLTEDAAKQEQQRQQQQNAIREQSSRTNSTLQQPQTQLQQRSASPAAKTNTQTLSGSATPQLQSSTHHTHARTSISSSSFIDRVYKGQIVDRYPAVDHADLALPPGCSMFCIPDDIRLTTSGSDLPLFYYFSATTSVGVRLYGACLKFYEPLDAEIVRQCELADAQRQRELDEESELRNSRHRIHETESSSKLYGLTGGSMTHADNNNNDSTIERSENAMTHNNNNNNLAASSSSNTASGAGAGTLSAPPDREDSTHSKSSHSHRPMTASAPPPASSSQQQQKVSGRPLRTVYAPKCICILSTHAFLSQFREFLTELYRQSLTPNSVPLERVLCNFVNECPIPPLGLIRVEYRITDKCIVFCRPPPNNPIQFTHFPVRLLFECLDIDNALMLLECVLLEKRILLISSKLSALTVVAETLLALIYPFQWRYVFIPLLPRALIDFLYAPMPFIIGMHRSFVKGHLHGELLDELVIVDLDKNIIHCMQRALISPLPSRERKKLKRSLKLLNIYKPIKSEYESKLVDGQLH